LQSDLIEEVKQKCEIFKEAQENGQTDLITQLSDELWSEYEKEFGKACRDAFVELIFDPYVADDYEPLKESITAFKD